MRDILDVCDKLPNRRLGQEFAPSWHPVRTPLINAQDQIGGARPVNELALAQRWAHAPTCIRGVTTDTVELKKGLHPTSRGLRILTKGIVDRRREGHVSWVET